MTPNRKGYAKSDDTRRAILAAAAAEFGAHGYADATTRRIAAGAGVTLPAIAYHFGSKEGLYLACAEEIARLYLAETATLAADAEASLAGAPDHATCRLHIMRLLGKIAALFAHADGAQAAFVSRALRDEGPAVAVLHERLWEPGVSLMARLIAALAGAGEATTRDRLDALLLLSTLLAFYNGRDAAMRIVGWDQIGPAEAAAIEEALQRIVDGLAAARQG